MELLYTEVRKASRLLVDACRGAGHHDVTHLIAILADRIGEELRKTTASQVSSICCEAEQHASKASAGATVADSGHRAAQAQELTQRSNERPATVAADTVWRC